MTTNFVVRSTNTGGSFSIVFKAPDPQKAKSLAAELDNYFSVPPKFAVIPPWSRDDSRSKSQKSAHERARATIRQFNSAKFSYFTNSLLNGITKKVLAAERLGDAAEVTRLRAQQTTEQKDLERRTLESVRDNRANDIDRAVWDLYASLPALTRTNRIEYERSLEPIELLIGSTRADASRSDLLMGAHYGDTRQVASYVTVRWILFKNLADGVPALIDWLCSQGCKGLKYEVELSSDGEYSDGDADRE